MSHGSFVRHQARRAAISSHSYGLIKGTLDKAWLRRRSRLSTYSQFGEDREVADRIGRPGRYLDIGANHPFKSSNTYLLYTLGWRGMTIEPIKSLCDQHRKLRPRDVCVHAAAGAAADSKTFHELNPSGFSTFDSDAADELRSSRRAVRVASYDVPIVRAGEAWLDTFPNLEIDLLSIDTEGFELDVLAGIDFEQLRPAVILIEFEAATGGQQSETLTKVLTDLGYGLEGVFGVNGLFARHDP